MSWVMEIAKVLQARRPTPHSEFKSRPMTQFVSLVPYLMNHSNNIEVRDIEAYKEIVGTERYQPLSNLIAKIQTIKAQKSWNIPSMSTSDSGQLQVG